MSNFLGMFFKQKKIEENRSFHDGEILNLLSIFKWQILYYVDLGMVFKQSFKYLKNEKIILSKVILKLEWLFYQNIYLLFHHILYS